MRPRLSFLNGGMLRGLCGDGAGALNERARRLWGRRGIDGDRVWRGCARLRRHGLGASDGKNVGDAHTSDAAAL
jgi:hypothetical protein